MIRNEALINVVRSQGYRFKKSTGRVNLYKERGGTRRIAIRRNRQHAPEYARIVLRDAGMSAPDIEEFIVQTDRRS